MRSTITQQRYSATPKKKSSGATYTPKELSDFVAANIIRHWNAPTRKVLRILDPAVGDGQLLESLLLQIPNGYVVDVFGYDNDSDAVEASRIRLKKLGLAHEICIEQADFLEVSPSNRSFPLLESALPKFDLIIANPPYVRTQIIGAKSAQQIASQFGLNGRIDLYHAFIPAIGGVLADDGTLGLIVSNRFMTTRAGESVRAVFLDSFQLRHVWDFGDTKLFDAAVLPAVVVANGKKFQLNQPAAFSSIYETKQATSASANSVTEAMQETGIASIPDGRSFLVKHGSLKHSNKKTSVWRLSTPDVDDWLETVSTNTWKRFGDLGPIRVGVKTCADKVFIRDDWHLFPETEKPELLVPLTSHHIAWPFRAKREKNYRQIVYPHIANNNRRAAVDLSLYPRTEAYLKKHSETLHSRTYLVDSGRKWYELWVPQDPSAWPYPKLVFRDIAAKPCFWIDENRTVVNGDCYWLACDGTFDRDLLWLAASVGNSTFAESFYDHSFNNKLYAGRRRFNTQYVGKFPIPDPTTSNSQTIIELAKQLYEMADDSMVEARMTELDALVWNAFGLDYEEIAW